MDVWGHSVGGNWKGVSKASPFELVPAYAAKKFQCEWVAKTMNQGAYIEMDEAKQGAAMFNANHARCDSTNDRKAAQKTVASGKAGQ